MTYMKYLEWGLLFFASVISGILAGLITIYFLSTDIDRESQSGKTVLFPCSFMITEKDLVFLEKDDIFSTLPVIGRGGCGQVRKANILLNGTSKSIAIKKVILPSSIITTFKRRMSQIESEIQTVGKIRHKNILPLLAYISWPTYHYLVYEYMNNGSLNDRLEQVEIGIEELDWLTRYKIAVGLASVLEYLHTSVSPRIVHRDIKPANVLLDDDMEARVTDFGLANFIADGDTHKTFSTIDGSRGFIAPEFYRTGKYTEMCDIYSFGVLLAVLVNGKLPSHTFYKDTVQMDMMVWMRKVMLENRDNRNQLIHQSLVGNGHEEHMLAVLRIACFCAHSNPQKRPTCKQCKFLLDQSYELTLEESLKFENIFPSSQCFSPETSHV